ncbi:hypothetical protein [Hymenobacter daecheongensis]|nr:hypothetical protein [Hymenobacter daecheongensis]
MDEEQPFFLHDEYGLPLLRYTYYPAEQLLHTQWYGNLTADSVIFGAQTTLVLAQQLGYAYLLNDTSQTTGDWSEAMAWLEYEWLPQAQEYGLRACAYVYTQNMDNQLMALDFLTHLEAYLPIKPFPDLEAARAWLLQQR